MLHTKPEQSKRFGPVAPQRYGEPKRSSIAAISIGSYFKNAAFEIPTVGATSIVGFGLASQTGFESAATAADKTTESSGEHDTSLASLLATVTRGRVWANVDVDKNARAKPAIRTRGNSFRSTIDRKLPSLIQFLVLLLLSEEGTAKDLGILAAEPGCFKRQCDCFVTKRLAAQWFALKEVTNQLRH